MIVLSLTTTALVAPDNVVKEGDRITVTPTKIEGAF